MPRSDAPNPFGLRPLRRRALGLLVASAAGVAAAVTGCGKSDNTYEISDVRQRTDAAPTGAGTSLSDRLGGAGDAEPQAARRFEWTTPAGWKETGPTQFREMGWAVAGRDDADCTFSFAGGGVLANVNRWRGQLGAAATDDAGLASLARRPLLGRDALLVELSGTYTKGGMGGQATKVEGAKLLGLIVELPATSAFLKMTGPAGVVDAEREHFFTLAASMKPAVGVAAAPADPGSAAAEPPRAAKPTLQWTVPDGWVVKQGTSMRLATFGSKTAPGADVSVTVLGGAAGGARANVDRWRDQMGATPLTDAEFEALAKKTILGRPAVFVKIEGLWAGKADSMLLGMVIERDDDSVFVKITGPAAEIRGEEARFRAFCESLHE